MANVHFKKDTQDSFFGQFLYQQVLPRDHFLVKAKDVIPWGNFTVKLLPHYKGGAEYGRSPYEPAKILRMLMIAFLYGISERETEEFVTLNLAAKYFVGLGVDEAAPDHSTLTTFKNRIITDVGIQGYEALFNEMLRIAQGKGITFGSIQIVDSVHTIANVNIPKDEKRKAKQSKPPRDPDAAWGVKRVKKVKQADGTTIAVKETFYGYKTHVAHNAQTGLTTAIRITDGSEPDNEQLPTLVNKDHKLGITKEGEWKKNQDKGKHTLDGGTAYTADKAYDDGDNHEFLTVRNLHSAIILKDNRTTTKQKENNHAWQAYKERPIYQEAKSSRYKVEQPFGTAKTYHRFARCRYLGKTKMAIQAYLTFMTLNLKRMMVLTTGVPFRNGLAYAAEPSGG